MTQCCSDNSCKHYSCFKTLMRILSRSETVNAWTFSARTSEEIPNILFQQRLKVSDYVVKTRESSLNPQKENVLASKGDDLFHHQKFSGSIIVWSFQIMFLTWFFPSRNPRFDPVVLFDYTLTDQD